MEDPVTVLRRTIPKVSELYGPVIEALKGLGGSATSRELVDAAVGTLNLSEEQQQVTRRDGRIPQIEQSIYEARSQLRKTGFIEQSAQGVWALTEKGERASHEELAGTGRLYYRLILEERERRDANDDSDTGVDVEGGEDEEAQVELSWEEKLIGRITAMTAEQFERLSLRILREIGFTGLSVTGPGRDSGVDGQGTYMVTPVLGLKILWQSKKYVPGNTVGAPTVRDLRGAVVGVADKGIIITTSTFTIDAKRAASEKLPTIDLIDGTELAGLMKRFSIGLKVKHVEEIELEPEFFAGI